MVSSSSISSTLLHNPTIANLKTLFTQRFKIQTADYDLLNKYVIHKFN